MSLPFNITRNENKVKQDINSICEALACSLKATEKIEVNAGKFGTISLNLCSTCIKKFQLPKENNQNKGNSSTKTSRIRIDRHCNNRISKDKQYFNQENDNNKK